MWWCVFAPALLCIPPVCCGVLLTVIVNPNDCSLFDGKESKSPPKKEIIVEENIISTKPEIVMSEIPLESILNDDDGAFVEKGLNDAETKEVKPKDTTTTTEITMIQLTPADDGLTCKEVITTSRTVVKGDGVPVTTVEKVVNGEEQGESSNKNLLSPPGDDEEKADEGSDDGGEKVKDEDKQEGEGEKGAEGSGKPRKKVKKKRSFKETFQGMIHRKKSDKDEDEEKS